MAAKTPLWSLKTTKTTASIIKTSITAFGKRYRERHSYSGYIAHQSDNNLAYILLEFEREREWFAKIEFWAAVISEMVIDKVENNSLSRFFFK